MSAIQGGCLSIEVNGKTVGTFRIVRYIGAGRGNNGKPPFTFPIQTSIGLFDNYTLGVFFG